MNKDFLSKPISFKDIDLKNINLKNIKRKKEIIIGILFIAYVIAVIVIGKNLLATSVDLKAEYERKEQRVKLLESLNVDEFQKKLEDIENEKVALNDSFYAITPAQFNDILSDFKCGSSITWGEDSKDVDVSLVANNKQYEAYDVYAVYIKSFSGSFNQVQEFLEYVKNYDKLVRVDAINCRKEEITGRMKGTIKLSFYFKKLTE